MPSKTPDCRRTYDSARCHDSSADPDLLQDMKSRFGMSIMLITHAMGVVAEVAQRVVVMYAGRFVRKRRSSSCLQIPPSLYPRLDPLHPAHRYGGRPTKPPPDHRRRRAQADKPASRLPLSHRVATLRRMNAGARNRPCASSNRVTRLRVSMPKRRLFNE